MSSWLPEGFSEGGQWAAMLQNGQSNMANTSCEVRALGKDSTGVIAVGASRGLGRLLAGMAWIVAAALDAPVEASRGWKRAGVE